MNTEQQIQHAQIDDAFMSEGQRTEFRSLIDDGMSVWDAYAAARQTR